MNNFFYENHNLNKINFKIINLKKEVERKRIYEITM